MSELSVYGLLFDAFNRARERRVEMCEGCDYPISVLTDWKIAPNGGKLHRACQVPDGK